MPTNRAYNPLNDPSNPFVRDTGLQIRVLSVRELVRLEMVEKDGSVRWRGMSIRGRPGATRLWFDTNRYRVVSDGRVAEKLTWERMLSYDELDKRK